MQSVTVINTAGQEPSLRSREGLNSNPPPFFCLSYTHDISNIVPHKANMLINFAFHFVSFLWGIRFQKYNKVVSSVKLT
jgi:hypothetical protein